MLTSIAGGSQPIQYQWLFKGQAIANATNASLTIKSASLSAGGDYSVRVSNAAGTMTSQIAALTVNRLNRPPTVSLVSPINNTAFAVGDTVELTAEAADSDGSVLAVVFYDGTTELGQDYESPYSLLWAGALEGTHTLIAAAMDDQGVETKSKPIVFKIEAVTRHPADSNPPDFQITVSEVTAYAAAWKQGKAWPVAPDVIPVSYMTRAAVLWKSGGTYHFDSNAGSAPACWVPGR